MHNHQLKNFLHIILLNFVFALIYDRLFNYLYEYCDMQISLWSSKFGIDP